MHTVNFHIDETITLREMNDLYQQLMTTPHVHHVELHQKHPHEVMVEFEEHHNMPMHLLAMLQQHGLHADIVGC